MKTRRLTSAEHAARLRNGVCPRCGDYRLVRVLRMAEPDKPGGKPKFAGAYWACGGPLAHECYHISSDSAAYLSESAEGTVPVKLHTSTPYKTMIVKRRKK